ncbi:hypothetical protein Tsp_11826 [Trichinella spiralis]|uniref:hypothetical protein n=1 Tax=Trichinella spiralis TaxID=6334 RepID=UPI0001EFDF77|nr:hypothetical protein Tsp_11826 [Trichinella spiralis]
MGTFCEKIAVLSYHCQYYHQITVTLPILNVYKRKFSQLTLKTHCRILSKTDMVWLEIIKCVKFLLNDKVVLALSCISIIACIAKRILFDFSAKWKLCDDVKRNFQLAIQPNRLAVNCTVRTKGGIDCSQHETFCPSNGDVGCSGKQKLQPALNRRSSTFQILPTVTRI